MMPGARLGQAWIWAEKFGQAFKETDREARKNGVHSRTISVGMAESRLSRRLEDVVDRARRAFELARNRGPGHLCGWPMVVLRSLLADKDVLSVVDPERRIRVLVDKAGEVLGPTQREHLVNHSGRVARLACSLGRRLQLGSTTIDNLRMAALYHDLGKFVVPEDVLAKPMALSAEERDLCERHCTIGAEICECLGLTPESSRYIRCHHHRFDEREWRNGADCENPPLGACVIALADAYDAMTSWRPYQRTKRVREAVMELKRERGRQFHPTVVDAAVQLFKESR